jgi:hypothetical protein
MTAEEYKKTYKQFPYRFSISGKQNDLFYFGEKHIFNPADSQWEDLRSFWKEFLSKTEGKKRIVFIEGGVRTLRLTEEVAIEEGSGGSLLTLLAHKESIEVISPEPAEDYERELLEKEFSRDEIQYYYFARIALQWNFLSTDTRPPFKQYVREYLERDAERSGWSDYDFSFEHMVQFQKDVFQEDLNETDVKFWGAVSEPYQLFSTINKVSRRSGEIRDEYISQQILKYWNDGYSIFANFGGSHAVVQEPYLKEVLS